MDTMSTVVHDLPTPGDLGLELGVAHASELPDFQPHPDETRLARALSPPRRQDFLLGRLAARRALDALGAPAGPVVIEHSRPRFSGSVVGSISHSGGLGVALVGFGGSGVGVDLELRRLSARAARGVCTASERAWAGGDAERSTRLFSAKESTYKTLPPNAQTRLRWCDIEIEPDPELHEFTAFAGGHVVDGWWRSGPAVLTWARCRGAIGQLGNAIG